MNKKMILFDLDGTLWDSSKQVADSWTKAIERVAPETGIVVTEDFMHRAMGKVMDEIKVMMFEEAGAALPKERQDEIYQACSDYEIDYVTEHGGKLYPEVEEGLKELYQKHQLGIVSNCQSGYIEAFLKYTGFGKYITEKECSGDTGKLKADNIALVVERNGLKPEDVVYIGDTMKDYESAMEAGVDFVHAAYGFGTVPQGTERITEFKQLLDL